MMAFTLISCTRASKTEVTSLKFDFSKVSQKGVGIIPLTALPTGTEVCYGVNVLASDLAVKNDKCAPTLGVFAGFIPEAKELSLEIPFGKDREVQLYAFLPKLGSACIDVNQGGDSLDPNSIYLVGKLSNLVFDQPEMSLAMPVSFPGVAHSIYSDLKMDSSCLKSGTPPTVVDPNAPVVLRSTLNTSTITSNGVDETIQLHLLVKSPMPVNFLTLSHDGPNGNISSGGAAQMFYACTLSNIAMAGHICEKGTVDDYYAIKTISVSQWAPNGTYTLNFSVRNTAGLNSTTAQAPAYTITNHPTVAAPVLANIVILPDSSLVAGLGGNIEIKFLVQSIAPPDFIDKSLRRPDSSYANSGGSAVTFTNCSPYTVMAGHICNGYDSTYWFYSAMDALNAYQQNGTYSYLNLRARNAGNLYSNYYSSTPTFSVAGNITPSTPTILAADGYYVFDSDPFTNGIPYYPGSCVRPEGTNLTLGVRLKSASNAPISWLSYTLQGPLGVLLGGANGVTSTDLGSGTWQTDFTGVVSVVMSAPQGRYNWNQLSVQNQGDLMSPAVAGPSLDLQNSCLTNFTSVSASQGVTCGISNNFKLKCWGLNSSNIIDHGSVSMPRKYPTIVDGYASYSQVARGSLHTCGINLTNHLYCWGQNSYGQLGTETTVSTTRPVPIDTGTQYQKITAGLQHTCGITTPGDVRCWGKNTNGQLGDSTTVNKLVSTLVDGGTQYLNIVAGDNHTCGITTTGALKCWGYNANGQIGDGTTTQRVSPTTVDTGVSYMHVDLGSAFTCGITTAGVLKCWGLNSGGQLGDGTTIQKTTPTVVDSGVSYSKVNVASTHSCGITASSVIKCWGQNTLGQLGDGSSTNRSTPTLISGGYSFSELSLGIGHSCGITTAGQMMCWGNNTAYQLGNGTTSGSNIPINID